jgi:hypothetical protein
MSLALQALTTAVLVAVPTPTVPVPGLVIDAVFDKFPVGASAANCTVTVKVLSPLGTSTPAQVTVPGAPPLCEHELANALVPLADMKVVFAGRGSEIVTPCAVLTPLLLTVI